MAPSESDSLFRDLCEIANELIQSVSAEGRFQYVNPAWLRTLGYRQSEVRALTFLDVIHPDSRDHCQRVMQELHRGRPVVELEVDFVAKDGRRITVEGSAGCRVERGRPGPTCGIFRDVTDRKQAEEELDRLFSLSLDLLCVAGTDGFFKQVNPAFERVLGYGRDELLSRSFLEFVHPDDRESTLREVGNLASGKQVVDFHNRYLARDGGYRWLAWRSAPNERRDLIYAVARDITDQKRDQELLDRQARDLARSNADLEQFAYVASHDLRAPLRSIANLTTWIEEDLAADRRDEAIAHLAQLRDRTERMQGLTEGLLRYSRAGEEAGQPSTVDTGKLVQDLVKLLGPPEGLAVSVEPGMPVLETVRAPLEQVFRNLIENAIKHHDRPNGSVVVSARERGAFHEFCVADDGPGIPAEYHDKVFEMFQQLESRDRTEGTGIGLALVARIVERQGGRLQLESGKGRGSKFRFTWPRRAAPD